MEKGKITSITFKNHLQNHCANFAKILHNPSVDEVDCSFSRGDNDKSIKF